MLGNEAVLHTSHLFGQLYGRDTRAADKWLAKLLAEKWQRE